MNSEIKSGNEKTFGCESCPIREKAEANPKSFMAKLWRWHTTWCPGWKEYQAYILEISTVQEEG